MNFTLAFWPHARDYAHQNVCYHDNYTASVRITVQQVLAKNLATILRDTSYPLHKVPAHRKRGLTSATRQTSCTSILCILPCFPIPNRLLLHCLEVSCSYSWVVNLSQRLQSFHSRQVDAASAAQSIAVRIAVGPNVKIVV
jgi:hypothetical protein